MSGTIVGSLAGTICAVSALLWIITLIFGLETVRHTFGKLFLIFGIIFLICGVSTMTFSYPQNEKTVTSSKSSKKTKLEIYDTTIDSVNVDSQGDFIIKGETDAPNKSIIMAQHPVKGQMAVDKAYPNDKKDAYSYPKVRDGEFSIVIATNELFDSDDLKVGQHTSIKIFAVSDYNKGVSKGDFDDYIDVSEGNFDQNIPRRIRTKLADVDTTKISITKKVIDRFDN